MEENIKNRIILILGVSTLIFLLISLRSCSDAQQYRKARDKERDMKFEVEEKFTREKLTMEEKLNAKEKELQEEKAGHGASKKALVQEQLVNQSLKEELLKVTKLKEALEEDLKEALVSGKSTKSKR
jgi:small-conductance mechanosensitive channel